MIEKQNPDVSLALKFRKYIEIATIFTLATFTVVLYAFPKFEIQEIQQEAYLPPIENIDIPPEIQQFEKPPPPARPSIPIESEDEDIDDDMTIDETDLDDFEDWDEPPPPPESNVIFVAYDEAPEPLGGYEAIQRNVVYPDIAREAGIEGTVIVQALIWKDGSVREVKILKGIPKTGLNEAAMEAIQKTTFKPAYQRDKAVPVRISIPVKFRLSDSR
jgi:periplasmic protein TonB